MDSNTHTIKDRIIFFDGVCNLCNSSVDVVMRHDKSASFKFASLQSDFAKRVLPEFGVEPSDLDSIALIDNGIVYQRSSAALKIAGKLSGLYPLLGVFWIVPKGLRNLVYDWVARNRYKWFGKKDSCRLPTAEERALFLD
jgi:predicted DCC family thiol-disulfide oxidoreductase YuxK